jgi:hypothetical protein
MRSQGWVGISTFDANVELVTHQINEMAMVREKVYNMEQAHLAMKSKYECRCSSCFFGQMLIPLDMRRRSHVYSVNLRHEGELPHAQLELVVQVHKHQMLVLRNQPHLSAMDQVICLVV